VKTKKTPLQQLYAAYAEDPAFAALREGRRLCVGVGASQRPALMMIGEAPGAHEDRAGQPFQGRAGKILDQMLEHLGLTRDRIFITNGVKYRPTLPGYNGRLQNRPPTTREIEASRPYLMREIILVSPSIIVPMGNHALSTVLPGKGAIGRWHGQLLYQSPTGGNRAVFPLYHPMYVGYSGEKARGEMWADLDLLKEIMPNGSL
jgi:uracil-DNA glycosylase family 4